MWIAPVNIFLEILSFLFLLTLFTILFLHRSKKSPNLKGVTKKIFSKKQIPVNLAGIGINVLIYASQYIMDVSISLLLLFLGYLILINFATITKYSFFLARRYLFTSKDGSATSRMSLIAIIVAAIAVAMPLIVISVLNGFHETIKDTRLEKSFHLKINCSYSTMPTEFIEALENMQVLKDNPFLLSADLKTEKGIENKTSTDKTSEALYNPVQTVTPYIEGQAVIRSGVQKTQGILFRGVSDEVFSSPSFLSSFKIKEDRGSYDVSGCKLLIGKALADKLSIPTQINTLQKIPRVWLIAERTTEEGETYFKPEQFGIAGVFESGMQDVDGNLVFVSLESARMLLNRTGINGIGIQLHNRDDVDLAQGQVTELMKKYPEYSCGPHRVYSWKRLNRHMFFALDWEKTLLVLVMSMMLIASFLTIFLSLNVVVMDKRKEVGILMSFGTHPSMIRGLFLVEGLLIGITGSVIGMVFGIWATLSLTEVLLGLEWMVTQFQQTVYASPLQPLFFESEPPPFKLVHSRIFTTDFIPYKIRIAEVVMLMVGSSLIAWVAAFLPALRASKQKPMESLRYE